MNLNVLYVLVGSHQHAASVILAKASAVVTSENIHVVALFCPIP